MNGILSFIWIRIVSWLNLKVYLPGSRPLSHWASGSERLDSPIIGWPALASLTCSLTESDRCPLESPEIETFDSKAFNQKQINNFSFNVKKLKQVHEVNFIYYPSKGTECFPTRCNLSPSTLAFADCKFWTEKFALKTFLCKLRFLPDLNFAFPKPTLLRPTESFAIRSFEY